MLLLQRYYFYSFTKDNLKQELEITKQELSTKTIQEDTLLKVRSSKI